METSPNTPVEQYTPSRYFPQRASSHRTSSFSSQQSLNIERRRSTHADRRASASSRLSLGDSGLPSPSDVRNRIVSHAGTLADELDSVDDEEDYGDEDSPYDDNGQSLNGEDGRESTRTMSPALDEPAQADGARDSGVDMNYTPTRSGKKQTTTERMTLSAGRGSPNVKNFSRPLLQSKGRGRNKESAFAPELSMAMDDIATLASTPLTANTIDRTIVALRSISEPSTTETALQRFAISTTSVASHLTTASRTIQAMTGPLTMHSLQILSTSEVDTLSELLNVLIAALPAPDREMTATLSALARDTSELESRLSMLLDTLQVDRQAAITAARVLKGAVSIVTELRTEQDRADLSMAWIEKERWSDRLEARQCARECTDVLGGFEGLCGEWKRRLESQVLA